MIDLKTYYSIQVNESIWKKLYPVALDLICFLVIYFSPQIKKGITAGGIKTAKVFSEFLKKKFPKLYEKILQNQSIANFLSNYPELIEEFVEFSSAFLSSNDLTIKAINMFANKIIGVIPNDNLEKIKSLLD